MGCTRCQIVTPAVNVDYVLLAAAEPLALERMFQKLEASGAQPARTELGIRIPALGEGWRAQLENVAGVMSEPERKDVRVAIVPVSSDPLATQKAMFSARSLEVIVEQFGNEWFRGVMERDAIEMHFQPLIQTTPGRVHAYECLMRGIGADGKLIPPNKMFQAAKSLDMLFLLDQKCRVAAVRQAAAKGLGDARVFINFTPTAIYNPEFCLRTTLAAVDAAGLKPEQITFEVIESEEIADRKHLVDILRFYREKGFKVALDDVGAGYSSLLALSDIRPDYIKIDAAFVRKAAVSSLEARILGDLAEAARQHGIMTVAEGVETEKELSFVHGLGIRIVQGWVFGKAQPRLLSEEEKIAVLDRARAATAV